MNTIKIERKNCRMVAHRGVSGLERENTCPAFVAAGVKSYFGVETDVHVTKDGKYIISHDSNIQRVTGVDMVIEQSNFDDLRAAKVFDSDGKTHRSDLLLPTLEDYVNICKKYDKVCVLELKEEMEEKHIQGIAETIRGMGWYEKTIFISFWQNNLVTLRRLYADAKAQFLTDKVTEKTYEFLTRYGFGADLGGSGISKEIFKRLHEKGIEVNCWTIDDPAFAKELIEWGADYLTTNILE